MNPNETRQSSAPYISRHRSVANFPSYHFARPVAIRRLDILLAPSDVRRVSTRAERDKDNCSSVGSEETAPGTARSAAQRRSTRVLSRYPLMETCSVVGKSLPKPAHRTAVGYYCYAGSSRSSPAGIEEGNY